MMMAMATRMAIGLDWQNNNAFCTDLSRCCMNTMQKVPNFTFCRGQKHN